MGENRQFLSGLSWRIAIAVAAFLLAFAAFEVGVTVSNLPNVDEADTLSKVYYALGLFVLGGLDLGVPQSGPWWGQTMLWVAYFGCPAIATAAVAEGVGRIMRAQVDGVSELSNHTVVAGCGTLPDLYFDSVGDLELEDRDILHVSGDPNRPFASGSKSDDGLERLNGDLGNMHVAREANVSEAALILLMTEDDVANLENALFLIDEIGVDPSRLVVHLSDISLMRDVKSSNALPEGMTLFNSHQIAARHLVEHKIGAFFKETDYSDEVILAGFGRFGQSLLETLDRELARAFDSVVILDRRAEFRHRIFCEQVGFNGEHNTHPIDGDMRDPANWDRATELLAEKTEEPVIVLGADDDALNLQVALWLRRKLPHAKLFVRTIGITHLANELAEQRNFEIEDVHRQMREYMRTSPDFRANE